MKKRKLIKKYVEAPSLNGGEELVLETLCKYHMLEMAYNPARVALRCNIPVWVIKKSLRSLVARGLVDEYEGLYIPKMMPNGAPIPELEIQYTGGVKIIKCPAFYANGYAQTTLLPDTIYE